MHSNTVQTDASKVSAVSQATGPLGSTWHITILPAKKRGKLMIVPRLPGSLFFFIGKADCLVPCRAENGLGPTMEAI